MINYVPLAAIEMVGLMQRKYSGISTNGHFPTMPTFLQQPVFFVMADSRPYMYSDFNLSTMTTSPLWQRPLKHALNKQTTPPRRQCLPINDWKLVLKNPRVTWYSYNDTNLIRTVLYWSLCFCVIDIFWLSKAVGFKTIFRSPSPSN